MNDKKLKNIFFIRSDRFGEFLLSLYAVKLARLNYPEAKISLLAGKENIELVRGIDFVDCFFEYNDAAFGGFRGALNLSRIIRKEKADCVVSLNPKKEFHLASLLSLAKLRVGYNRKFGFCLNRKIEDEKYKAQKHEVEYNLDLMKIFCSDVYVPKIDLAIDGSDSLKNIASGLDLTKKYTVIHPFTSNPAKKIEDDFWASLVGRLKNSCAKNIVIVGSKEEMEEASQLSEKLKVDNLAGRLSLRNLAAFFKYNCSVFVGLDSGPMHLASIIGVPVIGLFKASNAKRWGPFATQSLILEGKSEETLRQKVDDIIKFTCSNVLHKI